MKSALAVEPPSIQVSWPVRQFKGDTSGYPPRPCGRRRREVRRRRVAALRGSPG
jgi:hypothetical protein